MNHDKERRIFEDELRKQSAYNESFLNKLETGEYELNTVEAAWHGWLMAREFEQQQQKASIRKTSFQIGYPCKN